MSENPTGTAPVAKPTITTKEEFDAAMAKAQGPVIIDFMMDGCGHCDESQPDFEKLQQDCANTPTTIMRVDVNADWAAPLADKLRVEGAPTAMFAKSPTDMLNGNAREITDLSAKTLRRELKCALPPKK